MHRKIIEAAGMLEKASKAHAGQAKVLRKLLKNKSVHKKNKGKK